MEAFSHLAKAEFTSAFMQGLKRPSVLSVAVAVITILALFVGGLTLVTADLVAGKTAIGYLAGSKRDYDAFVTSEVFGVSRSQDTRPLVVLLGASVTMGSFGQTHEIAEAVRARTGVEVEVLNLCTSRQAAWEHAAIIDEIVSDRPILIVIGIGPARFTRSPEELAETHVKPRLGFRSEVVNDEATRIGLAPFVSRGNYFLDNYNFLLPRMKNFIKNGLIKGPVDRLENPWTHKRKPEKNFIEHNLRVMERFEYYDRNYGFNIQIFERLIDRYKEKDNVDIFLVEHPLNPLFLKNYLGEGFYAEHVHAVADFAERMGTPYWSIYKEVGLSVDEFYDWAHISDPEARARMRSALVAKLAPYLQ